MAVSAEEAAAAMGAGQKFKCPTCGKEFDSPLKVRLHEGAAHLRQRTGSGKASAKATLSEGQIREEIEKATGHMIGFGSILAGTGAAVHLGVTIAGVPDPDREGQWIVRSRAVIAGGILFEHAKRDARILEFVVRFNRFMEGSALGDVAGSVVAATAADIGVNPDLDVGFNLMGRPVHFQPIRMAIGDVVDFVQANSIQPPEGWLARPGTVGQATPRRPRGRRKPAVVEGGVTAT